MFENWSCIQVYIYLELLFFSLGLSLTIEKVGFWNIVEMIKNRRG